MTPEVYVNSIQAELIALIKDLCAIPAPSNHEELRAEFCRQWFERNGFEQVTVDAALNVIVPVHVTPGAPVTVVVAHTDTVFPDTAPMPLVETADLIASPGVVDDTASLAVMMLCARYYRDNPPASPRGVLFVANSGEEGLGNLKGTRQLVQDHGESMAEFVSLDAPALDHLITRAVGSHRYRPVPRTAGGHSFSSFGNRNAIEVLAGLIEKFYAQVVPQEKESRTTYNVGVISGGTSVNTIAQYAEMLYEYRSDSRRCLEVMRDNFERIISSARSADAQIEVEMIGERPCAGEVDATKLAALQARVGDAIRQVIGKEPRAVASSTDCNIPLSVGIPAVCFGVCQGSGCHTREEKLEKSSLVPGCRLLIDFLDR